MCWSSHKCWLLYLPLPLRPMCMALLYVISWWSCAIFWICCKPSQCAISHHTMCNVLCKSCLQAWCMLIGCGLSIPSFIGFCISLLSWATSSVCQVALHMKENTGWWKGFCKWLQTQLLWRKVCYKKLLPRICLNPSNMTFSALQQGLRNSQGHPSNSSAFSPSTCLLKLASLQHHCCCTLLERCSKETLLCTRMVLILWKLVRYGSTASWMGSSGQWCQLLFWKTMWPQLVQLYGPNLVQHFWWLPILFCALLFGKNTKMICFWHSFQCNLDHEKPWCVACMAVHGFETVNLLKLQEKKQCKGWQSPTI